MPTSVQFISFAHMIFVGTTRPVLCLILTVFIGASSNKCTSVFAFVMLLQLQYQQHYDIFRSRVSIT